jgi:hypothetical protein
LKKENEELVKISEEISWYENEARKSVNVALGHKLEIGKRLAKAKNLIPHGKFLTWARAEFGWTARHVQNHLKLAANAKRVARLGPAASMRMALEAIKESQVPEVAQRSEFLAAEPAQIPAKPGSPSPVIQRINLIAEVLDGTIDPEKLAQELERIAAALGATKSTWKVR